MPDQLGEFFRNRPPTADRPLLGQTLLVVEDSRYACEALRLMSLRSGARLRRADTLRSARRHLQTYRPTAVIVDVGLPDGSGIDLIAELSAARPRVGVILATSGDDTTEAEAVAAGADGFLAKPFANLGEFQEAILSRLPDVVRPVGPRMVVSEAVCPDDHAFRDDLTHVAEILTGAQDETTLDYVARFLAGVAKSRDDAPLESAAAALIRARAQARQDEAFRLAGLVQDRLRAQAAI